MFLARLRCGKLGELLRKRCELPNSAALADKKCNKNVRFMWLCLCSMPFYNCCLCWLCRLDQLANFCMDVWVAMKKFLAARTMVIHVKIVEALGITRLANQYLSNVWYISHWSHACEVCWLVARMYNPCDMRTKEPNETQNIYQVCIYVSDL